MKKTLSNTLGILLMITGSAFAGTGGQSDDSGWLWMVFLGFGALILVFQLVPSLILFGSMLKGLFSSTTKENVAVTETKGTRNS